jgi:hypothetical protein
MQSEPSDGATDFSSERGFSGLVKSEFRWNGAANQS